MQENEEGLDKMINVTLTPFIDNITNKMFLDGIVRDINQTYIDRTIPLHKLKKTYQTRHNITENLTTCIDNSTQPPTNISPWIPINTADGTPIFIDASTLPNVSCSTSPVTRAVTKTHPLNLPEIITINGKEYRTNLVIGEMHEQQGATMSRSAEKTYYDELTVIYQGKAEEEKALIAQLTAEGSDYKQMLDEAKVIEGVQAANQDIFEALGLDDGSDSLWALNDNQEIEGDLLLWGVLARTATGKVKDEIFGNGVITKRNYSEAKGVFESINTHPYLEESTEYRHLQYRYNQRGSVIKKTDVATNPAISESYAYDDQQRLTSWNYDDANINYREGYRYDDYGNIKQKLIDGDPAHTLSYDQQTKQLVHNSKYPTQNYHYDANGNITQDAKGRSYTWNSFNKINKLSYNGHNIDFEYGINNKRLVKRSQQETRYYVGPGYEYVIKADGTHLEQHTIHNGYEVVSTLQKVVTEQYQAGTAKEGVIAEEDTIQDRLVYIHRDLLGSGELITGSSGEVLARRYYSPYGEEITKLIQDKHLEYNLTKLYEGHNGLNSLFDGSDKNEAILEDYDNQVQNKLKENNTNLAGESNTLMGNVHLQGLTSESTRKDRLRIEDLRGFTSHEMLDEVGIIHMNARLYDAEIGRFLTADSLIPDASEPLDFNRYMYVRGNPASASDPTGHWLILATLIAVAAQLTDNQTFQQVSLAAFAVAIGFAMPGATTAFQAALNAGVSTFVPTFVATGDLEQSLKAGAISSVAAGVTFGVLHGMDGQKESAISNVNIGSIAVGEMAFNMVVQGAASKARGGKFAHGALSGFVSKAVGHGINPDSALDVALRSFASGAIVTKATGGSYLDHVVSALIVYLYGGGVAQKGQSQRSAGGFWSGVKGVVGKIWALPNTILGLVHGGVGYVAGNIGYAMGFTDVRPTISLGHNAIQFHNNPFMIDGTAVTLGNTISYSSGVSPSDYGAYGDPRVNIGLHEQAHTHQYESWGPLFLPIYGVSQILSGGGLNHFESAAQDFGAGG